ncbi:MAG: TIGR01906 family membrane protein [Chloroflexota bacterium]
MRILLLLASWVGTLLIPIVVVFSILTGLFFDASFYHAGQAKYQVQSVTGMAPDQMDRVNVGIIRFFAGTESLHQAISASGGSPDVFKEKEILHMDDVRVIVQFISKVQIVGLLVLAVVVGLAAGTWARGGRLALSRALTYGAIFTIALVIVSGILTYTSFDSLFITFHEVTFNNNYWELDPRTDHLIQMFPFGFWYDAMLTVALRVLLVSVVLGTCGVVLGRLERRRV